MNQFITSCGQYWSFSFSIGPSNEQSGLNSFRIDQFYLFGVQGTFKSLLQHHISKTSVLQPSAFFIVQPSHPYMTTGKNIALTIWTIVTKAMSLLFNMLQCSCLENSPTHTHTKKIPSSNHIFIVSKIYNKSSKIPVSLRKQCKNKNNLVTFQEVKITHYYQIIVISQMWSFKEWY